VVDGLVDPGRGVGRRDVGAERQRHAGVGEVPVAVRGGATVRPEPLLVEPAGRGPFEEVRLHRGDGAEVGEAFDGAISTTEFPIYKVEDEDKLDPHYLKLLLRSEYFQNAIRAIVTGHSNRRRTQQDDFEDLEIFIPEIGKQRQIAAEFAQRQEQIEKAEEELDGAGEGNSP
jgi:type I restriction enzyme M protein